MNAATTTLVTPTTAATSRPKIAAGRAIVEALVAAGVTHAFGVPGESFLGVLDALYDEPRIRLVTTRHEGAAAFAADAFGKLTGRPALCMGTRMVGGGNLSIGIHHARQESTPMLALMGQVQTEARHREAFQEADLADIFGRIAKYAVEPPAADRLAELTLRAARIAVSGRPGPAVVIVREDLLHHDVESLDAKPFQPARPAPDPHQIGAVLAALRRAERPVMFLGGGVLFAGATDRFVKIAEAENLPVMAAWRRPDVFPNDHPLYLGHAGLGAAPGVAKRLLAADVVLAVGTRLNEYSSFNYQVPRAGATLIHVDIDPTVLGGHLQADLGLVADAGLFADALLAAISADPASSLLLARRAAANVADRATWEQQTTPTRGRAGQNYVDQQAVLASLRQTLSPDTVIVLDAGNFSGWQARYLRWNQPGTFTGPTSGAMGCGVPSAIAAKLAKPNQPVVCFAGDGGFMMTGVELETAVRENTPFVVLVYDNGQYGTIRMHQERHHPGRPIATKLGPIDFAGFARSLGAVGFTVRDDAEFPAAFREAQAANRPALLHLRIDPEQISVANDG